MLKQLLRAAVIGASVAALAACGGQTGANDMPQNGYRTNATGAGQDVRGTTGWSTHNNRSLRLNQEVARAIERLDGISRARVIVGDRNAYVAVETNGNAGNNPALGGSNARHSMSADDYGMRGNYYGATDSRAFPMLRGQGSFDGRNGTGRKAAGTDSAAPEMYGLNGAARNGSNALGLVGGGEANRTGEAQNGARQNVRGNDATEQYMYNGGAYGRMDAYRNNNGLSQQVRGRVESIVRSLVPDLDNVYVSADPNFVERLGTFSDNSFGNGNGRNLISEFNAWVGRIFNADGDMNRYDMNYDGRMRNRNGGVLDNSFDLRSPRHQNGTSTNGTGMNGTTGTGGVR